MAKALRQRVGQQYTGTQRTRKAVHGECTVELAKWTPPIISLSREPYEAKVSRTGLTGGMGRRTVRQRALCLPSDSTSRRFRRHLHRPLSRFLKVSRSSTPQGSLPACASGNVATRIRPATGRPSLFPTPIPASPLVGLTTFLPFKKERYGLTTFRTVDKDG